MPSQEKDKQNLVDNLLRQGLSKQEIDKVYHTLREKGYGEEEARRRSRAALEGLKAQRELEERRRATVGKMPPGAAAGMPPGAAAARAGVKQAGGMPPGAAGGMPPGAAALPSAETDRNRRAVDWMPEVPPWLRRRINRYAFRGGFLITRLPERFDDFMSVFDHRQEDFVNRALLRLLSDASGYRGENPFTLSFIDDLDALRDSARRLLGRRAAVSGTGDRDTAAAGADGVLGSLHAREPFAVEFFGIFAENHEALRRSLAYLGTSLHTGRRVPVVELARVVKDGCRFIAVTQGIERDRLDALFDIVREVNLAHRPGDRTASELAEAEGLFRAGFQNLRRYDHELYPALLKMIVAFYKETDQSPAKRTAILDFLGIHEEDILTWEGWQRRRRELHEKELAERQGKELARLEQEKAEKFSSMFEGTLATLSSLFPESGIERVEQGQFVLPYFANRIFTRTHVFQGRLADLERLSSSDAIGLIMVLHAILDDMLASLEPYALETLLGREGIAAAFIALRGSWQEASPRLFEPYLDQVRQYVREIEGDPRYAKVFKGSERARGIEEKINQLRNRAIKNFGHILSEREHYDGEKLYEMASRLRELLADVGLVVNQGMLAASDPVSRKTADDLAAHRPVDFVARSRTGSAEYRPVTRQIKRWIEARFRASAGDIPGKAQVAFMDVFRGVAELYEYLLNDPKSFAAQTSHGVIIASAEDRDAWTRERTTRGRDSFQSLQATLLEDFPGQFIDALTGLRNKDFFLNELPGKLEKLRGQRKPVVFLMIDIDHFKWVNDELGHPKGDEVLKSTGSMILDNIREGDLALRYGGEELLIVVPSDLHTGIVLAERLRFAQESRVTGSETLQQVAKIGQARSEPCGTLSIGVADVTAIAALEKAVERVDKALYAAKRTRNLVVFVDPGKEKSGGTPYSSYPEYRKKAR
jgi:diguanylate cyclase (GGDEF)-like protein